MAHPVLEAARIRWDEEGRWHVAATDSYRLFEAYSDHRLGTAAHELLVNPNLLHLKAGDTEVTLEPHASLAAIGVRIDARQGARVLHIDRHEGKYPRTETILSAESETEPGFTGCLNPELLQSFCKAAKILKDPDSPRRSQGVHGHLSVSMETLKREGGAPIAESRELRPAVIRFHGTDPAFECIGLLMPVRV